MTPFRQTNSSIDSDSHATGSFNPAKLAHILFVEDDNNLGAVTTEFLEMRDFSVVWCQDGESGLKAFCSDKFDLCILDVMMPKKDGLALAEQIKQENPQAPIIFVTAKDKIDDKSRGYAAGGDDYLTKPFSMEELVLRINAVLRRYETSGNMSRLSNQDLYRLGNFTFDYQLRILKHDDEEGKKLSTKEAELLKLLCQHENSVMNRDKALTVIWGDDNYYNARSMDVFITKLRKYLKSDDRLEIMNVHGTGYKLIVPRSNNNNGLRPITR